MKLGLQVTLYCGKCDKLVPGYAFLYVPHGWSVETFLERARPLDSEAGVVSNGGFTCTECLREGRTRP